MKTWTAPTSSAYAWSIKEMGFADFNDERLTLRGVKIAGVRLANPQESIPSACGNWADTKATYRFFDNPKVQSEHILAAHYRQTKERCHKEETILIVQDTTTMNFSNKQVEGLGRIGMGDLQGFFVHSALAVTTQGRPLGLIDQKRYVRKPGTDDPQYKKQYKKLPIEQKETSRWVESIGHAKHRLSDTHIVVIGDRESDIYDVFKTAKEENVDVLIRTAWNRSIADNEKLFDRAKKGIILGMYQTDIPLKDAHKSRNAVLTIRTNSFGLFPAKNSKRIADPIALTILDIVEENPPDGIDPIHWILTTSLSVASLSSAQEKVQWYMYRWRIERFHFILKTGALNVEDLQLETFTRLKKVVSLWSIVAWRILWTVYESREHPYAHAGCVFSTQEVALLAYIGKIDPQTCTLQQAIRQLAQLGGFLGRKHDKDPGIKTLWRGFQKLPFILYGFDLAKNSSLELDLSIC